MTFAELLQWARAHQLTHVLPALARGNIRTLPQLQAACRADLERLTGAADSILQTLRPRDRSPSRRDQQLALRAAPGSSSAARTADSAGSSLAIAQQASARHAPPIYSAPPRGSLDAALRACAPDSRAAALAALRQDEYARSAQAPRDSRWKTWCRIAGAWGLQPLPLTVELVQAIAAALKQAGYRSAEQYFSIAKQHHIEETRSLPQQDVLLAIRRATRSVARGLGGPARKDAFRIEGLAPARLHAPSQSVVRQEDIADPLRLALLGAWFMCRGIELLCARTEHIVISPAPLRVTWLLPASKTDTAAAGVSRTHGCVCQGGEAPLCPVHVMLQLLAALPHRGRVPGPLFPTRSGKDPTPEAIRDAIRTAAAAAGEPLTAPSPSGGTRQRFGEHALRVSGAQMFARWGLALYEIQLLGRWGSDAVERYVQEAPLTRLATGITPRLQDAQTSPPAGPPLVPDRTTDLSATVDDLRTQLQALQNSLREGEQPFVVHASRGTYHICAPRAPGASSAQWKTRCGWAFAAAAYFFADRVPTDCTPCRSCHFPRGGRRLQTKDSEQREGDSSSDSSDSSSSD